MAMQTNLSKKDNITIAILVFAAVIFMIIWFLIKPAVSSIMTTDDKIRQAELKQNQYKSKIMLLNSSDAIYNKSVEDLDASTVDFYKIMNRSEIDRMVTSYVLKSGLFAENLVINMPVEPYKESPYIYSEINNKKDKKSDTADPSSADKKDAESLTIPYTNAKNKCKSTESSGVMCADLTLVVTGSRSVCQAFIDDICSKPAIRVTGFKWSKVDPVEVYNEETKRYEKKDSGNVRLSISFNLYMADVADYSTAVNDSAV